ncbi:hypothetical protein D3C81_2121870 [compost metagenome]
MQIALGHLAAEVAHHLQVFFVLDAFGNHSRHQLLAHGDDAGQHAACVRMFARLLQHAAVDLDLVERHAQQAVQR